MAKTYKHIVIPNSLIKDSKEHIVNRPARLIQNIPKITNIDSHKQKLNAGLTKVSDFQQLKLEKTGETVPEVDLKIRFRGMADPDFIERYHAKVFQKYDDRPLNQEYANDVVIAKIKTIRDDRRSVSDYELFQQEFDTYLKTGKHRSIFNRIDEFAPLTLEEITEPTLYSEIEESDEKLLLDVVFGSNGESRTAEYSSFKDTYSEDLIVEVHSEDLHYFRLLTNKDQLEEITTSFSAVISIEKAPIIIFSSGGSKKMDDWDLNDNTSAEIKPILLIDSPINKDHEILKIAALEQVGGDVGNKDHGTEVGSLVTCGRNISMTRQINVEHKILPINAFITAPNGQVTLNEPLIEKALKDHHTDSATIANFSINYYQHPPYLRKKVDKMTILFDQWSRKYNTVFSIATGNAFMQWPQEVMKEIAAIGYPDMFLRDEFYLLPPADSINNIAVGSIAYGATPDSMADSKDPSPITRKGHLGIKHNYNIKPDVVGYDSNFDLNFQSEDNGPYMAAVDGGLTRAAGTSFASPLSAFELGMLAKEYPEYRNNTLKALHLHFAEKLPVSKKVTNNEILQSLTGHGMPDLDKALHSLSYSTSLILEDTINTNQSKRIKIPMPASISGSSRLRLKLKMTLVYDPPVNQKDLSIYNPIVIAGRIIRSDGQVISNATSTYVRDGAHRKSNSKVYNEIEKSTLKHMGEMWELEVIAEPAGKAVTDVITQNYSVVLTIEDIEQSEDIDLHEEISQMIELELATEVDVELDA